MCFSTVRLGFQDRILVLLNVCLELHCSKSVREGKRRIESYPTHEIPPLGSEAS